MSNLAFVAATSQADTSFANSTINAVVPGGTAAGQMQIAWVTAGDFAPNAAPAIATPGGWTPLGASAQFPVAGGLLNIRINCYGKKATGADADQVFATSPSVNCAMGALRASYNNPDPNGFFGQVIFDDGGPSTSVVLSALTTTRPNSLLMGFISQGTAQSIAPGSSGMTERVDNAAIALALYDVIQAVAGSSGTKTLTLPASADFVWGFAEFYSNNIVTVAESITFADSQVALANFDGLQAEAITFEDIQDAIYRQFAEQAETIVFEDIQDAELATGVISEETITFDDSQTAVAHFQGLQDESITFEDVQDTSAVFQGLQDESITFEDVQDAVAPGEETVVEFITFEDSQVAIASFFADQEESINFVDSQVAQSTPIPPIFQFFGADPDYKDYRKEQEELRKELLKAVAKYDDRIEAAIQVAPIAEKAKLVYARTAVIEQLRQQTVPVQEIRRELEQSLTTVRYRLIKRFEEIEQKEVARKKAQRRRNQEIIMLH